LAVPLPAMNSLRTPQARKALRELSKEPKEPLNVPRGELSLSSASCSMPTFRVCSVLSSVFDLFGKELTAVLFSCV
jgi:hypothetical protein